jgi:nitrite reductase (NO-forming)
MADIKSKIVRTVSPFEPGSPDVDPVAVYGSETKEVVVKIIGNSFYPKSVQITEGTSVKWINEDVFTYMEGEFSGIHSVATYESPEPFASPLFGHTESYVQKFETLGGYKYMCGPHPYMRGVVTVVEPGSGSSAASSKWIMGLSIVSFIMLLVVLFLINSIKKKYTAETAKA